MYLDKTLSPTLLLGSQMEITFPKAQRGHGSYLNLIVACWGGVTAPLGPASELPVGGPVRPVCISLFGRCGRSIVCVIFSWWRKGEGGHIRSFAECLLLRNITPEPCNAKVVGPKGSTEGKDHSESKLLQRAL